MSLYPSQVSFQILRTPRCCYLFTVGGLSRDQVSHFSVSKQWVRPPGFVSQGKPGKQKDLNELPQHYKGEGNGTELPQPSFLLLTISNSNCRLQANGDRLHCLILFCPQVSLLSRERCSEVLWLSLEGTDFCSFFGETHRLANSKKGRPPSSAELPLSKVLAMNI